MDPKFIRGPSMIFHSHFRELKLRYQEKYAIYIRLWIEQGQVCGLKYKHQMTSPQRNYAHQDVMELLSY